MSLTPLTLQDVSKMLPRGGEWHLKDVDGLCVTFKLMGGSLPYLYVFHLHESSRIPEHPTDIDTLLAATDTARHFGVNYNF